MCNGLVHLLLLIPCKNGIGSWLRSFFLQFHVVLLCMAICHHDLETNLYSKCFGWWFDWFIGNLLCSLHNLFVKNLSFN